MRKIAELNAGEITLLGTCEHLNTRRKSYQHELGKTKMKEGLDGMGNFPRTINERV